MEEFTPQAVASSVVAVFTDSALLSAVTQFQRGVPLVILELTKLFDAEFPVIYERRKFYINKIGRYWGSVLLYGDLAAVQLLWRLRNRRDLASDKSNMTMPDLPQYAALCGRLDVLKWLYAKRDTESTSSRWYILDEALRLPDAEMALWVLATFDNSYKAMVYSRAAIDSCLRSATLLHELVVRRPDAIPSVLVNTILEKRNWEAIHLLHEHSPVKWSRTAMNYAAEIGHLDVFQFLHKNGTEGCTTDAMDRAAANGHLEMVKYLHQNRTEVCTTKAMDHAAGHGHLDIVQFLHENRTEGCTEMAMEEAALYGRLAMVRYLHENRVEGWGLSDAMDYAAAFGHLDVVQFLHENRTEGCTTYAMHNAAKLGHLEVVRYLHEHRTEGCTPFTLDQTASNGHLEVVRYLHEKRADGCSTDAMDLAAKHGHLDVVKFLHDNRLEGCTAAAMDDAATSGHVDVVKFLHEQCGMEAPDTLMNAVLRKGHLSVVQYLHETMTKPFDSMSGEIFAKCGNEELVEYVTSRLPEELVFPRERVQPASAPVFCFDEGADY